MTDKGVFTLPDPRYENYTWILQDEHNPAAHTPLISTGKHTGRVTNETGTDGIPEAIIINGVNYARADVMATGSSPFGMVELPETVEDLTRWRNEWLPEIDELADMLENFDPSLVEEGKWADVLDMHDSEYRRIFGGVHRTAVGPSRMAVARFVKSYTEIFGDERRLDAISLLQGFQNCSLDRVYALWDLSRMLTHDPSLKMSILNGEDLPDTPSAEKFKTSMDSMLREFGHTSNNGLQDLPTWKDGSKIPVDIMVSYSNEDESKNPRGNAMSQVERRIALETELRNAVTEKQVKDDVIRFMEVAQQLIPNLEDHNLLCDQRCVSVSRSKWLAIGEYLCFRDILTSSDYVFYYTREELVRTLEGDFVVHESDLENRKVLQYTYRNTYPPLYLGNPPENEEQDAYIPAEGHTESYVKGVAASTGVYRGRARVIQSLEEAKSLEEGDILVVRALTPPWTPYLGIIKAVVTNSGGELSHGAVVAREFGIPAVVGTINGTSIIWDGSIISVDGSKGLVYIEQQ